MNIVEVTPANVSKGGDRMAEDKNIGMVILGIVAIVAVIGLVLMFTQQGAPAGQTTSRDYGYGYQYYTNPGAFGESIRDPCESREGFGKTWCEKNTPARPISGYDPEQAYYIGKYK